jgi:transposase
VLPAAKIQVMVVDPLLAAVGQKDTLTLPDTYCFAGEHHLMTEPLPEQLQLPGVKPVKPRKYQWFVGIDVSKDKLDFAVLQADRLLLQREVKNCREEVISFCRALKDEIPGFNLKQAFFCMEQTGFYCNPSLAAFAKLKASAACANALHIRRSLGMLRGKDDRADAIRIAGFAQKNRGTLKLWMPRRPMMEELAYLVSLRSRLLSVSHITNVPLKEQRQFIAQNLQKKIRLACKQTTEAIQADLEAVEEAIEALLQGDSRLCRLRQIITSVKSVGNVTALQIILSTNEYQDITCPKKFACYAGIAPFKTESGLMKKRARVSPFANKKMKALLHICALNAIQHDQTLKAYYARKTKTEGKKRMLVINAVRYKLVLRIFACLRQDRLYLPDYDRAAGSGGNASYENINLKI